MPSAVIKNYEYFPETKTLRIVYQSGLVYDYLEVPQIIYDEFRGVTAKGVFLNRHIKTKFNYTKVEAEK